MSNNPMIRTIKIDGRMKGDIADHATFLSRDGSDFLDVYPVSKASLFFPPKGEYDLRSTDHLKDEISKDGVTVHPVVLHTKRLQAFLPAFIRPETDEIVVQSWPQDDAIAAAEAATSLADNFVHPKPDIMDFLDEKV